MTLELYAHIRATVRTRPVNPHNGGEPKASSWCTDGRVFNFMFGWRMDDDDPYPGEIAWIPDDETYPAAGPLWIASGDLEVLE